MSPRQYLQNYDSPSDGVRTGPIRRGYAGFVGAIGPVTSAQGWDGVIHL
jgi:hypothetical protein